MRVDIEIDYDKNHCADSVHRVAIGLEAGWKHALPWFRDDVVFVSCLLYGTELISLYVFITMYWNCVLKRDQNVTYVIANWVLDQVCLTLLLFNRWKSCS